MRKLERLCNSVEAEGEIIKENRSIKIECIKVEFTICCLKRLLRHLIC